MGVPVIEIDGRPIVGFDQARSMPSSGSGRAGRPTSVTEAPTRASGTAAQLGRRDRDDTEAIEPAVGNRFLIPKYTVTELDLDGVDHLLIDAAELLAILREVSPSRRRKDILVRPTPLAFSERGAPAGSSPEDLGWLLRRSDRCLSSCPRPERSRRSSARGTPAPRGARPRSWAGVVDRPPCRRAHRGRSAEPMSTGSRGTHPVTGARFPASRARFAESR